MAKYFVLIAFYFLIFSTLNLFGLSRAKYHLECKIEEREKSGGYGHIHLKYKNFSGENLAYMDLNDISFYQVDLHKANLSNAHIYYCNFKKANLNEANFSYTKFFFLYNLDQVKSVKGADFYKARGLRNKHKDFLRKHGAINVPENTTIQEDCINKMKELLLFGGIVYGFYKLVIATH